MNTTLGAILILWLVSAWAATSTRWDKLFVERRMNRRDAKIERYFKHYGGKKP